MTHYTVQFNSAIPVSSLEQERFQETLENWRGTHQLEFCWQPVPRLAYLHARYGFFPWYLLALLSRINDLQ